MLTKEMLEEYRDGYLQTQHLVIGKAVINDDAILGIVASHDMYWQEWGKSYAKEKGKEIAEKREANLAMLRQGRRKRRK